MQLLLAVSQRLNVLYLIALCTLDKLNISSKYHIQPCFCSAYTRCLRSFGQLVWHGAVVDGELLVAYTTTVCLLHTRDLL
jgi:hypothetical protein